MRIVEPETINEFFEIFNKYANNGDHYFRGQANINWKITPSISRNNKITTIGSLLEVERKLQEKFLKYIQDYNLNLVIPIANGVHHTWVKLMVAQHYGLPTRLLDFSHDKTVALLFAISDLEYLNENGALIIYENPTRIQKCIDTFKDELDYNFIESFFIQAPILRGNNDEMILSERRKFLQGSKFLYRNTKNLNVCISEDEEHKDWIKIIHINKSLKLNILSEIVKLDEGINNLFAGKNELDFFAGLLKLEFNNLEQNNIEYYLTK